MHDERQLLVEPQPLRQLAKAGWLESLKNAFIDVQHWEREQSLHAWFCVEYCGTHEPPPPPPASKATEPESRPVEPPPVELSWTEPASIVPESGATDPASARTVEASRAIAPEAITSPTGSSPATSPVAQATEKSVDAASATETEDHVAYFTGRSDTSNWQKGQRVCTLCESPARRAAAASELRYWRTNTVNASPPSSWSAGRTSRTCLPAENSLRSASFSAPVP